MSTNRRTIQRQLRALDDLAMAEVLCLVPSLIGSSLDSAGDRDQAIAEQWARREHQLVAAWVNGWTPASKFACFVDRPGSRAGTRPPGWWRFCAPVPRRPREAESAYLDRVKRWLPGEREQLSRLTKVLEGVR